MLHRYLIRFTLFIGYYLHELCHLYMCKFFDVYVSEVNWSIKNGHEIVYESVSKPSHVTWISYSPLIFLFVAGIPLGSYLFVLSEQLNGILKISSIWLGINFTVPLIPSTDDARSVLYAHRETTLVSSITIWFVSLLRFWNNGANVIAIIAIIVITLV